jgi:hypothetical protein
MALFLLQIGTIALSGETEWTTIFLESKKAGYTVSPLKERPRMFQSWTLPLYPDRLPRYVHPTLRRGMPGTVNSLSVENPLWPR